MQKSLHKKISQLVKKHNQKFAEKEKSQTILPFTSVKPLNIMVKNVKFEKEKKRLLTGRKVAK